MDTITHEERGSARGSQRAGVGTLLRWAAVVAALALAPAGCVKPRPPDGAAPTKTRAPAEAANPVQRTAGPAESTVQFMAFALNALLVPLFDDDVPPRWTDPSLSFDCDAGAVTVDDAPLDIGAPVPHEAFTVRWHMERCAPFDDAMELSGDVVLTVEPSGAGYRAVVQPTQLHVVSARGHDVLTEAFTARIGLGR